LWCGFFACITLSCTYHLRKNIAMESSYVISTIQERIRRCKTFTSSISITPKWVMGKHKDVFVLMCKKMRCKKNSIEILGAHDMNKTDQHMWCIVTKVIRCFLISLHGFGSFVCQKFIPYMIFRSPNKTTIIIAMFTCCVI